MSEQADHSANAPATFRGTRRSARPAGAVLRVALPSIIGVLLALLVVSPFSQTQEMSFVLDKDEVNMARERLRLTKRHVSRRRQPRPPLHACAAAARCRKAQANHCIRLHRFVGADIDARRSGRTGAGQGYYNLQKPKKSGSKGHCPLLAADGFSLTASNVEFALKTRQIESFGPVSGAMKVGTFSAGKLRADVDARIVRLEGGAHLRINQNAIR
jgi:lipopolysaccharide export system protein LptC